MPGVGSSIFNEQARKRLQTPDDLDRYVRVTSPSVWVALAAVLALVMGLLAWGIFGSVATTVEAKAVCIDGMTICLLDSDQVKRVHEGDQAYAEGETTKVAIVNNYPLSAKEVAEFLPTDYLIETMMPGKWAFAVFLEDDISTAEGVPYSVSIVTERVSPLSLVLG